jgi:hypothetical protein
MSGEEERDFAVAGDREEAGGDGLRGDPNFGQGS